MTGIQLFSLIFSSCALLIAVLALVYAIRNYQKVKRRGELLDKLVDNVSKEGRKSSQEILDALDKMEEYHN